MSDPLPEAGPARPSEGAAVGDPIRTGNWSRGLCGCFDNFGLCIVTFVLPCVSFGRLAQAHGDRCELYGCLYFVPGYNLYLEAGYREKIRFRRGVPGTMLEDCCIILLCPLLALHQELQEVLDIQYEEGREVIGTMTFSNNQTFSSPFPAEVDIERK